MTTIPMPRDPRTPLQQAQDQLTATRTQLIGTRLSRAQRTRLADRIQDLTVKVHNLEQPAA
ncbi:hypothetical protein [Streptomyces sp. NPDC056987]|uniref:hypothetical protein n=1 Tax=Streptomyces sp. NPDC056987 TaxID=3345988 RepID=UPI00362D1665